MLAVTPRQHQLLLLSIGPEQHYLSTVRTNAPHPNAAKLWVIFNTGPEAQRIREKETKRMNLSYPKQSRVAEVKKLIDESGAKIVRWLENDQSFKKMQWLMTTKDGRNYQKKLKSALRKGR